jgi:hypothetical protein
VRTALSAEFLRFLFLQHPDPGTSGRQHFQNR